MFFRWSTTCALRSRLGRPAFLCFAWRHAAGIPAVCASPSRNTKAIGLFCGCGARAASRPMKPAARHGLVNRAFSSLRGRRFILILRAFSTGNPQKFVSVTQTNFFLSVFFSITYRFSERLEAGGGTTVKSAGLPQFRAILTVKMPTDPIIIIMPGSWI